MRSNAVTTTALAGALTFLLFSSVAIPAQAQATTGTPDSPEATDAVSKPPYNIVFLIVDQRSCRLLGGLTMLCRAAMRLPAAHIVGSRQIEGGNKKKAPKASSRIGVHPHYNS